MPRKRGFTLVELLVVIAIIAVLLAVLLPSLRYAKAMAQRIQCSTKLKGIANAFTLYSDEYGGDLPKLERDTFTYHYFVYRRENPTGSLRYYWYGMGCLYGAKKIENPMNFYCPATEGWREEYDLYNNPAPWGFLPQVANTNGTAGTAGNQWVRVKKGYIYWPQSKDFYTVAKAPAAGEELEIYDVGMPRTPTKLSDLDQQKCLASDYTWHQVKGSGYSISVVFPDTHVVLNKVPREPDGRYWVFSGLILPDDVTPVGTSSVAVNAMIVKLSKYMFALQP
jgi:prepilin-type N-terminal cleavage/methylation domain-containing protein